MSVISSLYGSHGAPSPSTADEAGTPDRPATLRFSHGFQAMAVFNLLTFVLSILAFAAGEATLSLMFPQAWGLFAAAWTDGSGRAAIWVAVLAIGAVISAVAALRAREGERTVRAARASTWFGFLTGAAAAAVVSVAAVL